MGQHTPGPWRMVQVANGINVEPDIAKVYIQGNRYDGSQSLTRLANAQLIAAAPDLLAALTQQCPCECRRGSMTDDFGNEREIVDVCQRCAAIAKATN